MFLDFLDASSDEFVLIHEISLHHVRFYRIFLTRQIAIPINDVWQKMTSEFPLSLILDQRGELPKKEISMK
jgi:hypothetical protein